LQRGGHVAGGIATRMDDDGRSNDGLEVASEDLGDGPGPEADLKPPAKPLPANETVGGDAPEAAEGRTGAANEALEAEAKPPDGETEAVDTADPPADGADDGDGSTLTNFPACLPGYWNLGKSERALEGHTHIIYRKSAELSGWVEQYIPRKAEKKGQAKFDKYYLCSDGERFRSLADAQRHAASLEAGGGPAVPGNDGDGTATVGMETSADVAPKRRSARKRRAGAAAASQEGDTSIRVELDKQRSDIICPTSVTPSHDRIMVTPPPFRLQSPRSDLSGYARRRATATRPRPDGHFRHEDQLISSYKSLGSYFGNYWTGEEVADSDLRPFAPSALLQDGLGLCCGDQVARLSSNGYWQAAFVGIVGDPYGTWEQVTSPATSCRRVLYRPHGFRRTGTGLAGPSLLSISDKCPTIPAASQEAFLQRMPVQRRYPEESAGRNYGRSGHRDGLYGSRSQREPSRNRWSASRMPSDDSSHNSCRQEAPRFMLRGMFHGCPVGLNYKPDSKSQKPVVELKSASKSETAAKSKPIVELKSAVKSKPDVELKSTVKPAPVIRLQAHRLLRRAKCHLAALDAGRAVDRSFGSREYADLNRYCATLNAQFDRLESGESVSDANLSQSILVLSTSLTKSRSEVLPMSAAKSETVVKSKPAVLSEPVVESKPAVASTPAVASKPVVKSKPAVASTPALASTPVVKSKPKSVVTPKSADGPVSSFLKFVQSLADPMPAAVPKPAVKSPSVVQSTPKDDSKPAVTPKPAVELPCDVVSESPVAPPPVVELPPQPAAAPDQHDAIGFADGWTSRTSRACREPSPPSDDLHSSAVADCVKKYVEVQPRQKPRPRPVALASKKDGDQFRAARQTSLPVGTTVVASSTAALWIVVMNVAVGSLADHPLPARLLLPSWRLTTRSSSTQMMVKRIVWELSVWILNLLMRPLIVSFEAPPDRRA
ncbi:hypothetical protein THAOC_33204, partial [Thalassiosira oceanica]